MMTPTEFRTHLAFKIYRLFKDHQLTIDQMRDIMGITKHTWNATIKCEREVKAVEVYRLSQHFKCDADYFYPWAD